MADRLSAIEFAELGGDRVTAEATRTLEISLNLGGAWTDHSSSMIKYNSCKMSLANKHPLSQDKTKIPPMVLQVNNADLLFTPGSVGDRKSVV